jgi:hypothetical protein
MIGTTGAGFATQKFTSKRLVVTIHIRKSDVATYFAPAMQAKLQWLKT